MAFLPDSGAVSGLVPYVKDLQRLNTFGLPSSAQAYVPIHSRAELAMLAEGVRPPVPLFVLGGGSNVILPPRVEGWVAHIALRGIRLLAHDASGIVVEAAAGERWHEVVAHCVEQGWGGLENLALIPGTVGAAPVQNIGAYGVELKDRFDGLTAFDLQSGAWIEMSAADCRFAYRDSLFKHESGRWVIAAVRLRLPGVWTPVLDYPDLQRHPSLQAGQATPRSVFDAVCDIRRSKLPDPAVLGNAGSFFKNPVVDAARHGSLAARFPGLVAYAQPGGGYKLAAGWLIDQCGWKGRRLGPAGVHDRQALVLVNHGGAQARDILALAEAIRADVFRRYEVMLEPEPVVV